MKTKLLCCSLGLLLALPLAAKKAKKNPEAAKQTPEAVQPAAPLKFEKSKAWITGRVQLDSGYAKSVQLYASGLTSSQSKLTYLSEPDGTFAFEVDQLCPTMHSFSYDDGSFSVYLEPGDTLHLEFASSDFREGAGRKYPSLRFSGPNGTVNADLVAFDRFRDDAPFMYPHEAKTASAFKAGQKTLDSTYQAQVAQFMSQSPTDPKFKNLISRKINMSMAGYTWYPMVTNIVSEKQMPELFDNDFSTSNDENFVAMQPYTYYLGQVAQVPYWADTISKSPEEAAGKSFGALVAKHPAGLSRDVILLQAFMRYYRHREALKDIYAVPGNYMENPLVREAWDEYAAAQEQAEQAKATPPRNAYALDLKPAERFIADLFAPFKDSGKVLYVDVWGVGCGPCHAEMPKSVELHKKLEGLPVQFVYLCVSTKPEHFDRFTVELGIAGIGYHKLLTKDESKILMNYFNFNGIPRYWIVDKNGDFVTEDAPRPSWEPTYGVLKKLAEK